MNAVILLRAPSLPMGTARDRSEIVASPGAEPRAYPSFASPQNSRAFGVHLPSPLATMLAMTEQT